MRPIIDKRYVFIGSLVDQNVEKALLELTQMERDSILKLGIEHLGFKGVSGRLGNRFFTLVGNESFNESMKDIGKENIEARLRSHIAEFIQNA